MEIIVCTPKQLMDIKLTDWNCQRFLINERVNAMKESIMKHKLLCGCIIIYRNPKEATSIIIDGQHRYYAIKRLLEDNKDLSFLLITVQIITDEKTNPFEYFKLVNDTRPLDIKDVSEFTIDLSNEVTKIFQKKYKECFKSSDNPQKPNVNSNMFAELVRRIMKANCIDNSSTNVDTVVELVNDYNAELKADIASYTLTSSQKDKAIKYGFYIGIERDTDTKRMKFNRIFRKSVWTKYHGNYIEDKCIGCGNKTSLDDVHMAHIVSLKKGGNNTVENILPLCPGCNLSCGTKNAVTFVNENRHKLNLSPYVFPSV